MTESGFELGLSTSSLTLITTPHRGLYARRATSSSEDINHWNHQLQCIPEAHGIGMRKGLALNFNCVGIVYSHIIYLILNI